MFQYFGQRLKRDLKQLVDRRLDASVMASGSVLKVSSTQLFLVRCLSNDILSSRQVLKLTSSLTNVSGLYPII